MRILFLTEERISFTEPMVRGGAIHVRNVVEGLRNRGHEVFLQDWNDTPERSFQLSITPRSRFVEGPIRTAASAYQTCRRYDIDVIVSKTRKTYLPGLVAARGAGILHVAHVGSSLDRPITGFVDRVNVASVATRLRAPHDAYLVVCEYISEQLRRRGVQLDRIFDVRNAVDAKRFHPEQIPVPLAERFRNRINTYDTDVCIGFVGGLQPYKGLEDLAEAMEMVTVDCKLLVAGDGPERKRLERVFEDAAIFLGSVPYEQVPALYHEMDLFVLPSHTEGLPRVILEAQATATPVIATRVGGVPEVVTDGKTGILCEPNQPSDLSNAVECLAKNPSRWDLLGDSGRFAVEDEFSWESMFDRYERYLALIAE